MTYILATITAILSKYLAAFLALVVIFAIEKLDFVLRIAVENELNTTGFLLLFVTMIPSILDTIIPIATVVSVYLVVLAKREGREFLILSAAGSGLGSTRSALLAVGTLACVLSVVSAGFLKPAANFTFRTEYDKLLSEVIAKGPSTGRFFVSQDTVAHVWGRGGQQARGLRVFSFEGPRLDQVFMSDCARLVVEGGELLTSACKSRFYAFKVPSDPETAPQDDVALKISPPHKPALSEKAKPCRLCPDEAGNLDVVMVEGARSARVFDMKSLFRPLAQSRNDEMDMGQLLDRRGAVYASTENAKRAAIQWLMALTNLLAIAIAILGVAVTTPRTRFLALPGAIALVTGGVVLAGSGALIPPTLLNPTGLALMLGVLGGLGLVAFFAVFHLCHAALIAPKLGRT